MGANATVVARLKRITILAEVTEASQARGRERKLGLLIFANSLASNEFSEV